jgi:hypothetical protein
MTPPDDIPTIDNPPRETFGMIRMIEDKLFCRSEQN